MWSYPDLTTASEAHDLERLRMAFPSGGVVVHYGIPEHEDDPDYIAFTIPGQDGKVLAGIVRGARVVELRTYMPEEG